MNSKIFLVGEACFAKVKGYPAWPAEVTAVHGNKMEVFFFGTHEVARIGIKDLFKASPENLEKFSKPQYTSRRKYKEGLTEMAKFTKKESTPDKSDSAMETSKTPSEISSKTRQVTISTPTEIPLIRSKDSGEISGGEISGRDISPIRFSESDESLDVKYESLDVKDPDWDPSDIKGVLSNPIVLLDSRDVEKASSAYSMPRKSPNKRKMEKQAKALPKQSPPKKASRSDDPTRPKDDTVKLSIQINLEMNPETFLRLAKEVPSLLAMATSSGASSSNI